MNYRNVSLLALLFVCGRLSAQHYTAIHGSGYFGSLNVDNNPSSIVNTPYKWDLTIFGAQFTGITNTLRGRNFPFYLQPSEKFAVASGNYVRRADLNYNVHLLNARFSVNKDQAVAFGVNLRGYVQGSTGTINYNDSVKGALSFLSANEENRTLQMRLTSSAWMEIYGAYAFTLWDREMSKLTGGVTLKILRGMSGMFADVGDVSEARSTEGDRIVYKITDGHAKYGYSDNHGDLSTFSAGDLFSGGQTRIGLDIGAEYLIKSQAVTSVYDEDMQNDYEWKIGVALLDIGANRYRYGTGSRASSSLKNDITGNVLQDKFVSIKSVAAFNDSLATIVNNNDTLTGKFSVMNPTRLVVNADRYISGNFYVNGELSLNFFSGGNGKTAVNETSLISLTPRWERRRFGVFLPVQYTQRGNFWIGGAVKAGPVVFGTHNLLNIFSRGQYISGGAYLAIVLRPGNFIRDPRDRQLDCPKY